MADAEPGRPRLSLVVPATGGHPALAACLAAVHAGTDQPDELVVVDSPATAGPAAARNEGAARSTGDVLVFIDADVLVHPDAIGRIRAHFEDPGLAGLFGSYDDAPADPGTVSGFRNLLHHHVHQQGAGEAATFWSGLGAVRRDAFERAGGFNADRFPDPSIEDVELGLRLHAGGSRVLLDPDLQATHLKRWTLTGMVRTDFERRAVPWVGVMLERRELTSQLNLGTRHRASALLAVGVAAGISNRRPRIAIGSLLVFLLLNSSLYRLLLRRRGPLQAAAGVGLHLVHHLTAVAAVPVAISRHLRRSAPPGP